MIVLPGGLQGAVRNNYNLFNAANICEKQIADFNFESKESRA
jgi:hypothetical protein